MIILLLITSLIPLENSYVEISQNDCEISISFYNQAQNLIGEIKNIPIYGYKISSKYLYLITDNGLEVYNSLGKKIKIIKNPGFWFFSWDDKYLACVLDDTLRLYENYQKIFEATIPSKAVRQLMFSLDNKYLGVILRNHFLLIDVAKRTLEWTKEFPSPLIWGKFYNYDTTILVTEDRKNLNGKVYLILNNGQINKELGFNYQSYEEQIQNIEIIDKKIIAQTHCRTWIVSDNEVNSKTIPQDNYFTPRFSCDTIAWPLSPTDSIHPLGNNWGEFQNYGGSSYYHPGIDILSPYIPNVAVYAVKRGYVKAWLTTGNYLYWRLAIADSSLTYADSCDAYLYAHIDSARYHKNIGDTVEVGELIGYLVYWPIDSAHFHHLHFAKIRDRGAIWPVADWAFIFNPLLNMIPNIDTIAPVFENASGNFLFAFCRNNTSNYLVPTNLHGDVDIIAKIYDKFSRSTGDTIWDRLIPLKIEYEISGPQSIPRQLSFIFNKRIPPNNTINVVYKEDNICRSRGDYDYRDYYFIVTNTDGDSIIETTDAGFCWRTTEFPNGTYWIKVYASDASNNVTVCSMPVVVNNSPGISIEEPKVNELLDQGQIYNIAGKKISYNTLNANPGIYFILNKHRKQKLIVFAKNRFLK
ncbi:MAG: M23 family metallopeptidase [candidate division WOR-3 bacterium]|nr:M23 family metallopeptidase [candidate division WOR-3 bacterium]MCX7757588.1 M23 family metallopeptidase [candidate division WOR-3 bacterium]MDW7987613.1 M23 family metallopeptidase [candidate division WOR-3 bacterium]